MKSISLLLNSLVQEAMKEKVRPFLSEKQIKVLELRYKGLTLSKIAEIMGTTKANICLIEKKALRNIRRARETINTYIKITAPIKLSFKEDTNIFQAISQIYRNADRKGIKVKFGTAMLLRILRESLADHIEGDVVRIGFEVYVGPQGDVVVEPILNKLD